jgi:Protein of unknown function (DUF1302)
VRMNQNKKSVACEQATARQPRLSELRPLAALLAAAGALCALPSHAFEIESDNPDLKMRWDNTFKYSLMDRLKSPSAALLADPNLDDGNRNFKKGLASSRVDWLSEFDVSYQNFGARVSAAAWYDQVYNRRNDNDSPLTSNSTSVAHNEFTDETRKLHGRDAEILDAYLFGKFDLDGRQATVRLGKHTVIYGESLFFGGNGIAGAQAPVDVIKALSVPGSQVKEVLMPVNQISTQVQLSPGLSLGAYYQFEWKPLRLPGVGSYFSGLDMGGPGAESLLIPLPPGAPAPFFNYPHGADQEAKNSGQGGAQIRFRPNGSDTEYGLYALNYHAKVPWVVGTPAEFGFAYPENIKLYGASFSTVLGDASVAGEVSVRNNNPLTSQLGIAKGNTAHAQVSAIYALPPSSLWDNASLLGEVAWNRITSIKENPLALDPNADRDAWGFRAMFEPTWYQVMPMLDISVPINLGYSPKGRSAVAPVGTHKGGDLTLGVNGEYAKQWKFGLSYTHYFGSEGPMLDGSVGRYNNTFKQSSKDRDFIAFNVQRTF